MGDFKAVIEAAAIQLAVSPADLVLKIQSDEWGGRWVNIGQSEIIPDKTILRAVIRKSTKVASVQILVVLVVFHDCCPFLI